MKTVVLIPAYNEEKTIFTVIQSLKKIVDTIIVVDDGSTDSTAKIAKDSGAVVLHHLQNCGQGAAIMTGICAARLLGATKLILFDADGQHDSQYIEKILRLLDTYDVVLTHRYVVGAYIPLMRRLYLQCANILALILTGVHVKDSQCGLKAFSENVINTIDIQVSGFEYSIDILREIKLNKWSFCELPVTILYTKYSLSKGQSFSSGVKTAAKIIFHFLRL